jgi:hypothetical protein
MKNRLILSSLVVLLGVQTLAQNGPVPPNDDHARHGVAISLLRAINTAEVTNKMTNGSFVAWADLIANQPKYFDQFLARNSQNHHFAGAPEVLPGWNLRLNIHADGQGYDVLLRDTTDQKCGYAALSDESGVIRQSKAIDCDL